MGYDHIVIAHKIPGGSQDVARYNFTDPETGEPIVVWEQGPEIHQMVAAIFADLESQREMH